MVEIGMAIQSKWTVVEAEPVNPTRSLKNVLWC
jgi:hypothetical protein